jgi:phosphoribosylglycinamide formyltransferase-1
MLKVGVLISGRGSNLQALIAACAKPDFPAEIVCVISNKDDAKGLEYARAASIPTLVIAHRDYADRPIFEAALNAALEYHEVQLVCLAGFMRILTSWFVNHWHDRLINIHPSLLPSFPGMSTHQKVLDYGAKLSGCTIHFVRAGTDNGPIVLQAAVPVMNGDTEESLAARVLVAEHKAYPTALRLIAEGRVNVVEERTFIADALPSGDVLFNPKA